MNIVIYAHYQPPAPSASATRMASLARHLIKNGHQVTLLTSQQGPTIFEGIPIIRANGRWGLLKWLMQTPPCPILVSSPPATPAAEVAIVAKILGYKVIGDFRDPYVLEALKNNELKPGLRTSIKAWLEKKLVTTAQKHSFVSEFLKTRFEEFSNKTLKDSVIAPNGVDLEIFKESATTAAETRSKYKWGNSPIFVYQGILGGKDLDKVLKALAPALKKWNAKFLIISIVDKYSEPVLKDLKVVVESLNLQNQVEYLQNLTPVEMAKVLNGCDIGVNPLPSHRDYCLPVKTYEYMACGLYNLAHANMSGALHKLITPEIGQVTESWENFELKALAICENITDIRLAREARVNHAVGHSRVVANETLEELLIT